MVISPQSTFKVSHAQPLSRRFLLILAAIALPSVGQPAIAAPVNAPSHVVAQASSPTGTRPLPQMVVNQVLLDASQRLNVARDQLQIEDYRRQTWSDSCLGLGDINESCALVTVPGWQITIASGQQRLVYRTDLVGRIFRLSRDSQTLPTTLPTTLRDRLLEHVSNQTGVAASELEVVSAEPQFWDGCLGIYVPNQACTMIGISGWRAIVSSPTQSWVWHMDGTGSNIRLNETASSGTLIPQFMASEARPSLSPEVVFQMVRTGGIAGQTMQVRLLADGQIVQSPPQMTGSSVPYLPKRLTPEQIQQFIESLDQHQFQNFNGLSYPAPTGAADYFTITLTSQSGTTQYVDMVQSQLPPQLQDIIQTWDQLQDWQ
ncbi:MAG: hypothetical protein SFY66_26460 [Oculatellaceae cyanobacterium bins.114]|nr:hypothetical protein [Oculatellaceae cyanobacterium bins.114]